MLGLQNTACLAATQIRFTASFPGAANNATAVHKKTPETWRTPPSQESKGSKEIKR